MTYLSVGRHDEAASHAPEALTLSRRLGARGSETPPSSSQVTSCRPAELRTLKPTTAKRWRSPASSACARSSPTATSASASSMDKRSEAQEHLTTAATMYREMDMRFWLEQAETQLSESG
jgi:hypothetical protein